MSDVQSEHHKTQYSFDRDFPKIVSPLGGVFSESGHNTDDSAISGPRSLDCGRIRKKSKTKKQRDIDASHAKLSAPTTDSAPDAEHTFFRKPQKSASVPSLRDRPIKSSLKNVTSRIDTGLTKAIKKPIKTLLSPAMSDFSVDHTSSSHSLPPVPHSADVTTEFASAYEHAQASSISEATRQDSHASNTALQTTSVPYALPTQPTEPSAKTVPVASRPQRHELGPICDPAGQESRTRRLSDYISSELNVGSSNKPPQTSALLLPQQEQMDTGPSASAASKRKLSQSPEVEPFQRPKRPVKLSSTFKTRQRNDTVTSNIYAPLNDVDIESENETPTAQQVAAAAKATLTRTAPPKPRTAKVPPIVLSGVASSHAVLLRDLK